MQSLRWVLAVMAAFGGSELWGQTAGSAQKPAAFPTVPITAGATVRYSALPLDTWTGRVAYLLVEGDSTNGYSRLYVWIPNDSRFGRPVAYTARALADNPNRWEFGEIQHSDASGEEKVSVRYSLYSLRQSRGAGSQETVDYLTGKTVTRSWEASTSHSIWYRQQVGYAWGKDALRAREGEYPLELVHTTDLPLFETWEKVPMRGLGAMSAIVEGRHQLFETRDREKGRVVCQFTGFRAPTVIRAPMDGEVTFKIIPYMRDPIWEECRTLGEFQQKPFEAEIPYGWYNLALSGFRYGSFSLGGVVATADTLVPLNRPPPQGR